MYKQLTIFDLCPASQPEPDVGEWLEHPGPVIPRIMLPGYIGKKILTDMSTQSHKWYKVGILEEIRQGFCYQYNACVNGEYKKMPCELLIVFDGKKQRGMLNLTMGEVVYECLPWDAYPERMAAIGRRGKRK